ncbi:hypothetical protein TNCV_3038971 [Trichonephila clavipes]|nr:hypothetical protein TNCV_3038971 [Trichonephila clavipes]
MNSSLVQLKTRRVGERCTLNLLRAQMPSRFCGVEVKGGGANSDVVLVTRFVTSPRVAEQSDVNTHFSQDRRCTLNLS